MMGEGARAMREVKRALMVLGIVGKTKPTEEWLRHYLDFDITESLAELMENGVIWLVDGHLVLTVKGCLVAHDVAPKLFDPRGIPYEKKAPA